MAAAVKKKSAKKKAPARKAARASAIYLYGIALPVRYSSPKVSRVVAALAKRYDRPAVAAAVVGANADGAPEFTAEKAGLAVDEKTMRAALAQLLRDGTRAPLQLVTHSVAPTKTVANYGPVIVITRGVSVLVTVSSPVLS